MEATRTGWCPAPTKGSWTVAHSGSLSPGGGQWDGQPVKVPATKADDPRPRPRTQRMQRQTDSRKLPLLPHIHHTMCKPVYMQINKHNLKNAQSTAVKVTVKAVVCRMKTAKVENLSVRFWMTWDLFILLLDLFLFIETGSCYIALANLKLTILLHHLLSFL